MAGGFEWNWDDFYRTCIVLGDIGSGKTACVLNALLDGLLRSANDNPLPPAGLVLDPKGDFEGRLSALLDRLNREMDLVVLDPLDPVHSLRWNPFDNDESETELAARFMTVMKTIGNGQTGAAYLRNDDRETLRYDSEQFGVLNFLVLVGILMLLNRLSGGLLLHWLTGILTAPYDIAVDFVKQLYGWKLPSP